MRCFKLAAKEGLCSLEAQFLVGHCYENGVGVTKIAKEAVRYCKLAAEQGNLDAQHNLAICLAEGANGVTRYSKLRGVPTRRGGVRYLMKSAERAVFLF
jgi:TPR repeat protein